MCGRYVIASKPEFLAERFHASFPDIENWPTPRFNAAPGQELPVLVREKEGLRLRLMRWGFLPRWARPDMAGKRMINARLETAFTKPFFRDAVRKHRCLVPTSGFYEWKSVGGKKHPHFIHWGQNEILAFAGLWEIWKDPTSGEEIPGFAILTLPASQTLSHIHDRMPAVLPQEKEMDWLDAPMGEPRLMESCHSVAVLEHEVSPLVNTSRVDAPQLTAPLAAEEPPQLK